MSEMAKTMTFLGVALASWALAIIAQPSAATFDIQSQRGKLLDDVSPDSVKQMKVVRFNEDAASLATFEVANTDGLWTIPSKGGYPADADKQMAEAATSVMDREILSVVGEDPATHDQYGVIDPTSSKLEVGQQGVGLRVSLLDDKSEPVIDWIIGKKVKDSENQRYVRKVSQDVVYVIEMDTDRLSTNFADWIESDLLKIGPGEVRQILINDYSAEAMMTPQGAQIAHSPRTEMLLAYDSDASKWTAKDLKKFDMKKKAYEPFELADGEELDAEALDDLKSALSDLKIVDVEHKPEGMSADLKTGIDFTKNAAAFRSLIQRGYVPMQSETKEYNILSSEGEFVCTLRDGVEYVLRFGSLKLDGAGEANPPKEDDEENDENSDKGIHRYLFVMARLNEGFIDQPTLEELPELPKGATTDDLTDKKEDESAEEKSAKEDTAEEKDEDSSEEATEAKEETEEATDEVDDELKILIAERKRIELDNQRKLDQYQGTLEAAKKRVADLNRRFGDWYYLIADDVYKKIHLNRDAVIKKKAADEKEGEPESTAPTSTLGAPGTAIPGLPQIPMGE